MNRNKYLLFSIAAFVLFILSISPFVYIYYVHYNIYNEAVEISSDMDDLDNKPEYLTVLENEDFVMKEMHLDIEEGEIYYNDVKRIVSTDIYGSGNFDCEWKGKEVDNYYVKEEYCAIFNNSYDEHLSTPDEWYSYTILKINKDLHTANYQILINDKVITEKELGFVLGTPIQAIKLINDNFVVAYQTNLEIIPANEETQSIKSEGYHASIWVNGIDVLEGTDYDLAFSPHELNNHLLYFASDETKIALNYNGNFIDLPYSSIPHYGCCDESVIDTTSKDNVVDFFAMKEDGWYHVQVYGKKN